MSLLHWLQENNITLLPSSFLHLSQDPEMRESWQASHLKPHNYSKKKISRLINSTPHPTYPQAPKSLWTAMDFLSELYSINHFRATTDVTSQWTSVPE